MTQDFKNLIYIFKCAVHGESAEAIYDMDFDNIYKLALKQSVLPIIYDLYIKLLSEVNKEKAKNIAQKSEHHILQAVYKNIQKKEIIKCILNDCGSSGIECCLLKGWLFADLYAMPEYRLSGDIDLYINQEDEDKVIAILEKYGFKCNKAFETEYHSECTSDIAGLLELHTSLYDDYCEKIWFKNIETIGEDKKIITTKDGYTYTTLNVTDSMIFNSLHFIKHFLSSGIGIRQLMDIMLFVKYNKNVINENRFKDVIKTLHFDKLFDICSEIAVRYLGFKREEMLFFHNEAATDMIIEKVLDAIEKGGVFGNGEKELADFNRIYTAYILSEKEQSYKDYLKSTIKNNGFIRYIFLDRDRLSNKYNYAKNNKLLLPFAWIHRAFCGISNIKRFSGKQFNDVESDKIKLLKEIGII